jgi:hypothetical protein
MVAIPPSEKSFFWNRRFSGRIHRQCIPTRSLDWSIRCAGHPVWEMTIIKETKNFSSPADISPYRYDMLDPYASM